MGGGVLRGGLEIAQQLSSSFDVLFVIVAVVFMAKSLRTKPRIDYSALNEGLSGEDSLHEDEEVILKKEEGVKKQPDSEHVVKSMAMDSVASTPEHLGEEELKALIEEEERKEESLKRLLMEQERQEMLVKLEDLKRTNRRRGEEQLKLAAASTKTRESRDKPKSKKKVEQKLSIKDLRELESVTQDVENYLTAMGMSAAKSEMTAAGESSSSAASSSSSDEHAEQLARKKVKGKKSGKMAKVTSKVVRPQL